MFWYFLLECENFFRYVSFKLDFFGYGIWVKLVFKIIRLGYGSSGVVEVISDFSNDSIVIIMGDVIGIVNDV